MPNDFSFKITTIKKNEILKLFTILKKREEYKKISEMTNKVFLRLFKSKEDVDTFINHSREIINPKKKNISRITKKKIKPVKKYGIITDEALDAYLIQRMDDPKYQTHFKEKKDYTENRELYDIIMELVIDKCKSLTEDECKAIYDHIKTFKTYKEAYEWIRTNGKKDKTYAIPDDGDYKGSFKITPEFFDEIHPPQELSRTKSHPPQELSRTKSHPPQELSRTKSHPPPSTKIIRRHSIGGKQTKKKRHPL